MQKNIQIVSTLFVAINGVRFHVRTGHLSVPVGWLTAPHKSSRIRSWTSNLNTAVYSRMKTTIFDWH